MTRRTKAAAALPLLLMVVAVGARQLRPDQRTEPAETELIVPGADHWVPFSATVTITSAGKETIIGTFHRRSDGSERLVTGNVARTLSVVSIYNIPAATYYSKLNDGTWYSAPMRLPANGWRPTKRLRSPRYSAHPYRLSFKKGQVPSMFAAEGFEAYQQRSASGDLTLEVPQLAFFGVVRQSVTGRREEYTDIEIRESPPELFLPPPGVVVTARTEFEGIVSREPAEKVDR